MKINATIRYEEQYLPSKRHRKTRTREVEEQVQVELREITGKDAPVAMVVTDYKSYLDESGKDNFGLRDTAYLAVNGELFREKRDMRGALDEGPYSIEEFKKDVERAGDAYYTRHRYGKDREGVLRSINNFMSAHLLIDGVIHTESAEPRYKVMTFGLGHNHGGTSMFIDTFYNENISKSNYFNALQRDEAIAYAEKIAARRGDTESLGKFREINIQVYMPEMVRCDPNLEHGDGNPLLNAKETMVQASGTALEAGALITVEAISQLAEGKKPSLSEKISSASARATPDSVSKNGKSKDTEIDH